MAQFKKEEVFGPSTGTKPTIEAPEMVKEAADLESSSHAAPAYSSPIPRTSTSSNLLAWATKHRKLAMFSAFGVGVFLGAVARR